MLHLYQQNKQKLEIMKLSLNTLAELFGKHYGTGFYQLGTEINDLTKVMNLVDEGALSPMEIHELLTTKN